jgi:hypothetical protein
MATPSPIMVTRNLFGFETRASNVWCGRRDLNPHSSCEKTDDRRLPRCASLMFNDISRANAELTGREGLDIMPLFTQPSSRSVQYHAATERAARQLAPVQALTIQAARFDVELRGHVRPLGNLPG